MIHDICYDERRFSIGAPTRLFNREKLLLMTRTALVHSLSHGGFAGQTMSCWIVRFIETIFRGKVKWESDELAHCMNGYKVPFCGPVEEPWNEHLLRYVIKNCHGHTGMIRKSQRISAGSDLTLEDDRMNVVIQCKVFEESIDPSRLLLFLEKFVNNRQSKLDILIGYRCLDLDTMQKHHRFINVTILHLTREQGERTITVRLLYGDLKRAQRFLLVIGFNDLFFG